MPRRRTNHSDVSAISGANEVALPSSPMNRPCASANVQMVPAFAASA
jgi:hypothetical protein